MYQLSVIIPVYNAQDFLRQCLDSVLGQTLKELEVICVDDGSIDGSMDILREYQGKDSRVKILSQKNLHAGAARNNGLSAASGEYIHFLDADDWVEQDAYRSWLAAAKKTEADVCICFYEKFDHQTGEKTRCSYKMNEEYLVCSSFKKNPRYFIYHAVVPWNKIYRRVFLQEKGILFDDLICANDRFFYFRMLVNARRIAIVQEYWVHYRVNNYNSLVGQTRLKHYDCHFRSFEEIWELMSPYNDGIRLMVLDLCMKDFFSFYKKAEGTIYEDRVRKQLSDYLKNADFLPPEKQLAALSWYRDYCLLTGKEPMIIESAAEHASGQKHIKSSVRTWGQRGILSIKNRGFFGTVKRFFVKAWGKLQHFGS